VFVSVNYRLSPADPSVLDPGRIKFPDHPTDVAEALAWLDGHVAEYGGRSYYFCSPACTREFEAEPEKYVSQISA